MLRVIKYFAKSLKVLKLIRNNTLNKACVSPYKYSIVTLSLSRSVFIARQQTDARY